MTKEQVLGFQPAARRTALQLADRGDLANVIAKKLAKVSQTRSQCLSGSRDGVAIYSPGAPSRT
jgi:hypothetical protein